MRLRMRLACCGERNVAIGLQNGVRASLSGAPVGLPDASRAGLWSLGSLGINSAKQRTREFEPDEPATLIELLLSLPILMKHCGLLNPGGFLKFSSTASFNSLL